MEPGVVVPPPEYLVVAPATPKGAVTPNEYLGVADHPSHPLVFKKKKASFYFLFFLKKVGVCSSNFDWILIKVYELLPN
jgi:hypothetical protein